MKIDCETSTNYTKWNINSNQVDIYFDKKGEEKLIWFNIQIGKVEDDYLTVSFRFDDLLSVIGKIVQRDIEETR